MPAGRPSLYDASYCKRVIEFCAEGFSLTAFAAEIGVARSTVTEWASQHAEFSASLSRAKAAASRKWEERLRHFVENGGSGGQATAIIFALRNLNSDDFREVERREHSGPDGKPIEHSVEDQRQAEERRAAVAQLFEDALGEVVSAVEQ